MPVSFLLCSWHPFRQHFSVSLQPQGRRSACLETSPQGGIRLRGTGGSWAKGKQWWGAESWGQMALPWLAVESSPSLSFLIYKMDRGGRTEGKQAIMHASCDEDTGLWELKPADQGGEARAESQKMRTSHRSRRGTELTHTVGQVVDLSNVLNWKGTETALRPGGDCL